MPSADSKIWRIPGAYAVSFKTARGRRLYTVEVWADGPVQAGRLAAEKLRERGYEVGDHALREYGVSAATRVLRKVIRYGNGVHEEWRTDADSHGFEHVVESRQLSREEVRALHPELFA